jgi:hypothetical protein
MAKLAVEWLIERIINGGIYTKEMLKDLEQAKEMEKEEMLKFGIKCQLDFIKSDGVRAVDDLWEETYGGKK